MKEELNVVASGVRLDGLSLPLLVPILNGLPVDKHGHNRMRHNDGHLGVGSAEFIAECLEVFGMACYYLLREASYLTTWSGGAQLSHSASVTVYGGSLYCWIDEHVVPVEGDEHNQSIHQIEVVRVAERRFIVSKLSLHWIREHCDAYREIASQRGSCRETFS